MPLYSIGDKIILFIHVPKAGGTTVEYALADYCIGFLNRNFQPSIFPCSPQHFHGAMLQGILDLEKIDYTFMTVRHPFERIKSEYKWRRRFFNLSTPLDEWVASVFASFGANSYVLDNHLRPMVDYLVPNVEVFRLEDGLEKLLEKLQQRFPGADITLPDGREMSSGDLSNDLEFAPEASKLIRQVYEDDFRAFNYA
ncbi:sulfotransferase family 2 domain-containing protein [Methylocystis sp. L43]|uniref:sulfotransferase family 2 domain-containing protein n=1 Tax=unclassified Methylocystis TaxID=2625913 RepID=UPI0018C26185|nr:MULTISPECIES: sulfotransferase family 2 domain-containing protein [unclassified Methylocystis]MBG0798095.1 sulfotransferase family 2 domain-containing protein [Methylocystis sp. L43]MBG0805527.1 sulfotransferase family 2 domain-containing protein [Methylocystis sp. H15]